MSRTCEACGQAIPPTLTLEEYQRRAIPRLAAIGALAKRLGDFSGDAWKFTADGERYVRLMHEQSVDEAAAGL
jgi:hypothetical protein